MRFAIVQESKTRLPSKVTEIEPVIESGPPFYDNAKLSLKIKEYFEEIEYTYPCIHVTCPEDVLDDLTMATLECCHSTTMYAWLFHDTKEAFSHTCSILAENYCVEPELLEVAFWLLTIHYMDGEDENTGTHCLQALYCQNAYGVSLDAALHMMDSYGSITIEAAVPLASILNDGHM